MGLAELIMLRSQVEYQAAKRQRKDVFIDSWINASPAQSDLKVEYIQALFKTQLQTPRYIFKTMEAIGKVIVPMSMWQDS